MCMPLLWAQLICIIFNLITNFFRKATLKTLRSLIYSSKLIFDKILIYLVSLCSDSWYTVGLQFGWLHWIHPRRWTSRGHPPKYKNVEESKICKERKVNFHCDSVKQKLADVYNATLLKLHNFATFDAMSHIFLLKLQNNIGVGKRPYSS